MIDNAQALKDKAKNFAIKNNLEVQQVLQNYMFERFLERLSKSKYKNNFILKGGFLLSSIMGINIRSTMDIDANITGMDFSEDKILKLVQDIISIELNDNVAFEIDKSEPIKEDNEYGGYSFKIIGKVFNLKIIFHIDISTGDLITPKAIEYEYKTLLEDNIINLYTYNSETIIAEKLQTVLVRSVANSRMKDFYDLYYFSTNKWKEIDKKTLSDAINVTFKHRNSLNELNNYESIINEISRSSLIKERWTSYQNRFSYAQNVSFDSVIDSINKVYREVIK